MSDITHIVKSYEDELQNLNDNLIKMGSLVETQLSDSMEAIIKVDKDAAEKWEYESILYYHWSKDKKRKGKIDVLLKWAGYEEPVPGNQWKSSR